MLVCDKLRCDESCHAGRQFMALPDKLDAVPFFFGKRNILLFNVSDARIEDLIGSGCQAESMFQEENQFKFSIIAINIQRRVCLSKALELRLSECFSIANAFVGFCQNKIGGAIDDAFDRREGIIVVIFLPDCV